MIYLNLRLGKHNFDLKYNRLAKYLDVEALFCPCCGHKGLLRHGYYSRHIFFSSSATKSSIRILRVRCPHCGSTHAVFVLDLFPFIAAHLDDITSITLQFLNNPGSSYDVLADASAIGFPLDSTVSILKAFFQSRIIHRSNKSLTQICNSLLHAFRLRTSLHITFIDYDHTPAYTLT